MSISNKPVPYSRRRGLCLALTLGLGACATPHPLTHSNELRQTVTTTFHNRELNTSLLLNGDYTLELQPRNKPDDVTKARLKQLGLARKQAAVLFVGKTHTQPTYRLRSLRIAGNPDWAALGFQETGLGRYQRTGGTAGPNLLMEYAAPLPDKQGWLYLVATDEASSRPTTTVPDRSKEMDAEFVTFTFPSVQAGRWPRVVAPGRVADAAFFGRHNGDYLAPLVALAQARHAPPDPDPSVDGTLWYQMLQYHSLAGNPDSVDYFQRLPANAVRLPAALAPTRRLTPRPTADTLEAVAAVPEILRRTAGVRAVLLDESGLHARERALAAALLPGLYQQGYRYLALEALEDTTASAQVPLPLKAGFHAREAAFANLVRSARRLGFTLIAYQPGGRLFGLPSGQAAKIHRALGQDPQARVLVYGGGVHQSPRLRGQTERKSLAQYLAGLTGGPVLSISQTRAPNPARGALGPMAPETAEVVYQLRKGQRRSPSPEYDLMVRNNLSPDPLLLLRPDAAAHPLVLDVRPYRPTPTTGRRLMQLYLQSELAVREDIAPIYTHELRPAEDALSLRLVPGRYVYRVLSEKLKEEVRKELVVE